MLLLAAAMFAAARVGINIVDVHMCDAPLSAAAVCCYTTLGFNGGAASHDRLRARNRSVSPRWGGVAENVRS
ncbi:protein of unknown function [Hyphomicrobium sp. 1Nfss2.1]